MTNLGLLVLLTSHLSEKRGRVTIPPSLTIPPHQIVYTLFHHIVHITLPFSPSTGPSLCKYHHGPTQCPSRHSRNLHPWLSYPPLLGPTLEWQHALLP